MLRPTDHISRKLIQNIFRAFDFAKAAGMPINLFVVLHLHETDEHAASTMFESIRHKYRDWLNYQARRRDLRLPPFYVFTFEAPANPHVNWALRIPPMLIEEFQLKLPKWVTKVQGPLGKFDLDISSVESDVAYKTLANYMVKGCDPAFIDHYFLSELYEKHGPQGTFWGRRAGVSPALNRTARANANYNVKRRRIIKAA